MDQNVEKDINSEAAKIAAKLEIDDRVDIYSHRNPYVTIKDHKPGFPARMEARLVNPAKTQIGKVAKKILDRVIKAVRPKLGVNQWKSSNEVIDWFRHIQNKENMFWLPSCS